MIKLLFLGCLSGRGSLELLRSICKPVEEFLKGRYYITYCLLTTWTIIFHLICRKKDEHTVYEKLKRCLHDQNGICIWNYHFWRKNDGEKESRIFCFDILSCGKKVIFVTEFVILGKNIPFWQCRQWLNFSYIVCDRNFITIDFYWFHFFSH